MANTFIRFLIAGGINTFVGYSVFYLLHYVFTLDLLLANVGGYVVGLILSLLQMRLWVFPSQSHLAKYAARFFSIFVVAYCTNIIILIILTRLLGFEAWLGQLLAMVVYSLVSFFLSRKFLEAKGETQVQRNALDEQQRK